MLTGQAWTLALTKPHRLRLGRNIFLKENQGAITRTVGIHADKGKMSPPVQRVCLLMATNPIFIENIITIGKPQASDSKFLFISCIMGSSVWLPF